MTRTKLAMILLAISIVGNLLLALPYIQKWTYALSGEERFHTRAISELELTKARDQHESLLKLGVAQSDANVILAVRLRESMPNNDRYQYWTGSFIAEKLSAIQSYQETKNLQEALVAIAGESVRQESALRDVFSPLDKKFPFLSPQMQTRLQELFVERDRRIVDVATKEGLGASRLTALSEEERVVAEIKAILNTSEFLEYQLRVSPFAQRLATELPLSEAEFRQIALADTNKLTADKVTERAGPRLTQSDLDLIEKTVGKSRYSRYARSNDPTYQAVASLSERYRLPPDAAERAYKMARDAEVRNATAPLAPLRPQRSRSEIELENQLRTTMGEAAYLEMRKAIAERDPRQSRTQAQLSREHPNAHRE